MSGIAVDGVLDPLLQRAQSVPHCAPPRFSFRSDVTITLPFWFVIVICFQILLVVFLSLGFLYAFILVQPAIITIDDILSRTDVVVKSMVVSSIGAIANGNELVRSHRFTWDTNLFGSNSNNQHSIITGF